MHVLTWNVNFRDAECLDGIADAELDIVTLQEVTHARAHGLMAALWWRGLRFAAYSGSASDAEKRYGNIIASRWPVCPQSREWAPSMPWPQLAARATVRSPSGDIDVVTIHIPNGSGNGWKKIETFESLADALDRSPPVPRILTGDFNEPQTVLPGVGMVTWAQEVRPDGSLRLARPRDRRAPGRAEPPFFMDCKGVTDDLNRWDTAVRRALDEDRARHALRHVYRLDPAGDLPTTHVVRGQPRFFDHMLVSRHFTVKACRYLDKVRKDRRHSDHSAMHADLALE
jgi:endonuclease/exonuclease/phosphatase family metal-dependent hydrolase